MAYVARTRTRTQRGSSVEVATPAVARSLSSVLQVYSIVQKYGQGVNPAVTAMTGNPDDLFSNQQGGAPEQRSSGGRRDPAVTVSWWNTDELERSLSGTSEVVAKRWFYLFIEEPRRCIDHLLRFGGG